MRNPRTKEQRMSTTHTPGPWEVMADSQSTFRIHANDAGVAKTLRPSYGFDVVTSEANARLIAAAPDLLKALIDTPQDEDDPAVWMTWDEQRNEAIRKAKEES